MIAKPLLLAALASLAGSAHALSVIYTEDFDANFAGSNHAPSGWSLAGGTVDVVGPGKPGHPAYFANLCRGSGACVDLDGSSGDAGVLSRQLELVAGLTYTLRFDLAGNRRNAGSETVAVAFGAASQSFVLPSGQLDYQSHQLQFTPASSGLVTLSFANAGGDNIGALLDNVTVSSVPEPRSLALMLSGLFGLALFKSRRPAR